MTQGGSFAVCDWQAYFVSVVLSMIAKTFAPEMGVKPFAIMKFLAMAPR